MRRRRRSQATSTRPGRSAMAPRVSKLANVIVPVADQDRALEFYTEALGLEKRVDVPFGDGNRWIEVAPAGAETPIAICPPGPERDDGRQGHRHLAPDRRHRRLPRAAEEPWCGRRRRGQPLRRRRSAVVLVPRPRGQHADGRRGSVTGAPTLQEPQTAVVITAGGSSGCRNVASLVASAIAAPRSSSESGRCIRSSRPSAIRQDPLR